MGLNLNDPEAAKKAARTELLPFEVTGTFLWALIGYAAKEGDEAYNGDHDIATVQCLASTSNEVNEGDIYGLYFKQDGFSKKAKPFAIARQRAFFAAVFGERATPEFDAVAARKKLIRSDLSEGKRIFLHTRRLGKPNAQGAQFTDDTFKLAE